MALETGSFVNDLVATNPAAGDAKSQGDDHIRLIKTVLLATFPAGSQAHYPLVSGTPVVTTSGTAAAFTSIPSWVKKITINFSGVSVSTADSLYVQIGDSGGLETTGYQSVTSQWTNGVAPAAAAYTTGFGIYNTDAGLILHGSMVLSLVNSTTNTWVAQGTFANPFTPSQIVSAGNKALSATLDRVSVIVGAGAFDAGTINILYE